MLTVSGSIWCFFRRATLMSVCAGLMMPDARGILFDGSGDPGANVSAPTGVYEDSGWQFLGYYGGFLGTAIGPQHFITAQHFGLQGGVFSQDALFTGGATVNHTIDATANGGLGYWDIPGSDLRVFQIQGVFASYAEIYSGIGNGEEAVLTGRGGVRGDAVLNGLGQTVGWEHSAGDGIARWGTNLISGTIGTGASTQWVAKFDGAGGTAFEAGLSDGDSGGGLFIKQGGVWKLAGVNLSIDGLYDTNGVVGDGSEFSASMTDYGGFYQGSDGTTWTLIPDGPGDQASGMYFSSVTANASLIQSIVAVPEPSGAGLIFCAFFGRWMRRRRS
jgi:hypothetical protein